MTDALLFVLHGRRTHIPKANLALLQAFGDQDPRPYAIGFLEDDQQTLEATAADLSQSADHLIVVPVLLFAATHVRQDIPTRLVKALPPTVTTTILPPLGPTVAITQFTIDRLQAASRQYPDRGLVIVTHGTPHYAEPLQQLAHLAAQVGITIGQQVQYASLLGSRPIAKALTAAKPLVVLPLFLTDGRLVKKVHTQVTAIQPDSVFLPPLEDAPVIVEAIREALAQQ